MPLFFDGVIKILEKHDFTGKDGKDVKYDALTIQGEGGMAIQLNTQKDFTQYVDQDCTFKVLARKETIPGVPGSYYKLTLQSAAKHSLDADDVRRTIH